MCQCSAACLKTSLMRKSFQLTGNGIWHFNISAKSSVVHVLCCICTWYTRPILVSSTSVRGIITVYKLELLHYRLTCIKSNLKKGDFDLRSNQRLQINGVYSILAENMAVYSPLIYSDTSDFLYFFFLRKIPVHFFFFFFCGSSQSCNSVKAI